MALPGRLGALRDFAAFIADAAPIKLPLLPPEISWSWSDTRALARSKDAGTRLLIAPANYARQAYYWARAAETLPDVSATNMRFLPENATSRGFSDIEVRPRVVSRSHLWAAKQNKLLLNNEFTHVLIEACRPILPSIYGGDLEREIAAYQESGVQVAMVSHGTDVRLPSAHMENEPYSPYRQMTPEKLRVLEERAGANHALLDRLGLTEFVSTPDLLEYRPSAHLLPVITDIDRWTEADQPERQNEIPTVLHIPGGQPLVKGTPSIQKALRALEEEGVIRYVEANYIPHDQMPKVIRSADIIVNQVAMGLYSVVALEGMLAGKPVVAQVWDGIRAGLEKRHGDEVPIVEANPDTLYAVVRDLASDPQRRQEVGKLGQEWAKKAHSLAEAAASLNHFLDVHPEPKAVK